MTTDKSELRAITMLLTSLVSGIEFAGLVTNPLALCVALGVVWEQTMIRYLVMQSSSNGVGFAAARRQILEFSVKLREDLDADIARFEKEYEQHRQIEEITDTAPTTIRH